MERPNKKKGFKCNLTNVLENGWELEDFYRKKKKITSLDDLYEHYILFTNQQRERFQQKFPNSPKIKRDGYLDFLVNRHVGVCPQSIISKNSKHWFEIINLCDGEMGLSFPGPIQELPDLFFQALRIVREEKGILRKEEEQRGTKKNSHNN